ncbi:MAG: FtsQ-type POTRA domain-containing protein [Candidatus Symbiobacter sp.]|nr:FtsQ-type POTRA domain-containing protein [Candidatus Symbiobacter sp.]
MGIIRFRIFSGWSETLGAAKTRLSPRPSKKQVVEPLPLTLVRPAWLDETPENFRRNLERGLRQAKFNGGWQWSRPWRLGWTAPFGVSLAKLRPKHMPLWWSKWEVWRRRTAKWRHNPRFSLASGVLSLLVIGLVLSRPPFAPLTRQVAQSAWHGVGEMMVAASGLVGMKLAHLWVEGRQATPVSDIHRVIPLVAGDPIFAFDLDVTKANLEKLPWVATAMIERHLPDTVYVRLSERQPFAIWQVQNRLHVIDAKGVVLVAEAGPAQKERPLYAPDALSRDGLVAKYGQLPVVIGQDAPQAAEALIFMLRSEPALAARVTAATRVGGRRWNLRLDNRVTVMLPADDAANPAWSWLAELEARQHILAQSVTQIDLRLPDRLVLSTPPLRSSPTASGPSEPRPTASRSHRASDRARDRARETHLRKPTETAPQLAAWSQP